MERRPALAALGLAGVRLLGQRLAAAPTKQVNSDLRDSLMQSTTDSLRDKLHRIVNRPAFSGHIPADEVRRLVKDEATTVEALMIELLPLARTYARPPLSDFHVGAVVRGASGSLYLGANIEIPGHALGLSVHAEQAALSNAYMHDEQGVAALAVTAAPCGHCRQFMNELSPEGEIQVLVGRNTATRLSSLLPMAFGPKDLGLKQGAFPVSQVELALPNGVSDDLTIAALGAAKKSYAPYTKAHSGVAILTKEGRLYRGSYLENAAFNPSLSPLQTAFVALILAGDKSSEISRVVLVEVEGAPISQKSVTEAALSAVAPGAKLRLLAATKKA
jgi:cytidine deaminase